MFLEESCWDLPALCGPKESTQEHTAIQGRGLRSEVSSLGCDARFPSTAQIAACFFIWFEPGIRWFPGNLEIWLRYDFNMPLVEDLLESGTLQGHSGRLAEA